jgi:NADPH-dependent 2,4-dienoyl-CoA reductase/sulfur reductase-like enzyme
VGVRLLVIGGSDAGIAAALRARELDPGVEATVLVADAFPNFSICGLPYYLSGDVADWRSLAHRSTDDLEAAGVQLRLAHTARGIDPTHRQVTVTDPGGAEDRLGYDQLVIATGATPIRPAIDGLDLDGVHVLHTMADTFAVQRALAAGARSAVIVGGGYIGLEMAEAFSARGLAVTLVEQAPAVMPTVDLELGRLLGAELGRHGVQVAGDVIVKVFDLAVARTGLRDPDARQAGFDPVTVASVQFDHKAYYPGAHQLHLRLTGDRHTGRLLGAQLVGHKDAEVAKRIDIPAGALFHGMTVEGLSDLDLSYTPPFGSPWDAIQLAAHDWVSLG